MRLVKQRKPFWRSVQSVQINNMVKVIKHNCPWRDTILELHALQSLMVPLDHWDLQLFNC